MKKRFPALILLLTLLFRVTAYAAEPRLVVHLPEGSIEAGETFTVTVDLTGNPGILNIQFTLSFDRERMECTDMKIGDLLATQAGASAVNPAAKSGAILAAASAELMEGDGQVGVFHFRAKEKLSDFHFSIDRITLGDQNRKKMDVLVTDAVTPGQSDSDTAASDTDTTASDTDTGNSETPAPSRDTGKSDTGTVSGDTGKSDTGTVTRDTGKSDTGTVSGDTGKSDTGTVSGDTGKSDTGTVTRDTGKSDTESVSGGKSETPNGNGQSQTATAHSDDAPPPFSDIAGTWAERYIRTAAERNLFQGYPDGTFRPDNRLTRAQFVMVLWNLAGRPMVSDTTPFADMEGQIENFRNAVAWAYAKGYVSGTSPDTFSPGEPLTRQAAVKILFAYHGSVSGTEIMMTGIYDGIFSDSGRLSAWARDAMYWAVYQKIISGTSPTTLEPGGAVTRAQLAAIMVRYVERFQQ
ncbi:MAG: S-layer homology domain-containing protein [Oscillospiraceae bacterium]|nr:S-layer homology domain-containing protein [Oscillospiraceae bacterium]